MATCCSFNLRGKITEITIIKKSPLSSNHPLLAIAAATLAQAVGAWGMFVYTAGATVIADDLAVSATYIGYQIGIAYFAATICTLFSGGLTRSLGPMWCLAVAMSFVAVGSLVTTAWQLVGMFAGSITMGIGFGLIPASASQVLITVSERRNRALIFSIKQSGIPVGGMMSALTTPLFIELLDWRAAGYAVCLASFFIALILFIYGRRWINEDRGREWATLNPLLPILAVRGSRSLVMLMYMSAFYVAVQIVWLTFLSPFFVEDLNISLLEAGYLLAVIQVTGIFGRITWGWLSDRLQDHFTVMILLGWVMAICCGVAYFLSGNTPFSLLALLCFLIGFSAVSWNGVCHAAVVEVAPKGETVQAIAGMAFYVYIAMFVWPALFAFLIERSGSYVFPLTALILFALAGVYFSYLAKLRR